MNLYNLTLRTLGAAGAVAIVAGSIAALGSYSDARYRDALAAARQLEAQAPVQVAGEPLRIEVIGSRHGATRTAAHVDESVPRPQS